jgi:hypothetical protein
MHVALVYRGRYHVRQALDLETLAAVLRQGGHRVTFTYDSDTFGVSDNVLQVPWLARLLSSPEKVARRIAAAAPDAVVFSVLPAAYPWAQAVAPLVKIARPVPIIFTGLHPSLVPERVMRDTFVDYVIRDETENVILLLLEAISGRGDPARIGNLWYRKDGRAVFTFPAEPVDLNALPLPDKDLFRPYVSHAYSYTSMVSRGCPYQCTFCEETCARKVHGPRYFRRKGVESVMRELLEGKHRYRFREVIFKDSYLSGDKEWLRELMQRYKAEIGVPFKCFCTIKSFDAETARLLKDGGCYNVEFGLQTWNDRIRHDILNRFETSDEARSAFAACADAGLWYDVDHMFNLPTETLEDHVAGAREYRKLRRLNRIKVHYLVYLPTAKIVEHALRAGIVPPDVRRKLEDGWESDFYDPKSGGTARDPTASDYAALYKLLPALPGWKFEWLMRGRRVRLLRWIPKPLMALFQGLLALRSRDLRFAAYLRMYPVKIMRALADSR